MGQYLSIPAIFTSTPQTTTPPLVPRPHVFYSPRNDAAVLDLSDHATTPERQLRDALLSDARATRVVAAVGMGGTGKSTLLRALAYDDEVSRRFQDAVWYLELGQHATLSNFLEQLKMLVHELCPEFLERFLQMSRMRDMMVQAAVMFVQHILSRNVLLVLDNVWDSCGIVFDIVTRMCIETRNGTGALKILISTRSSHVAHKAIRCLAVDVSPRASAGLISRHILCQYAGVDPESVEKLEGDNQHAFEEVLDKCAGLPLALAVSGASVAVYRHDMDEGEDDQDAWWHYWSSLREDLDVLGLEGSPLHEHGLFDTITSSLQILSAKWPSSYVTSPDQALSSLCVMKKQMFLPNSALCHLWHMSGSQVTGCVKLLSESSLISRVMSNNGAGVRVHDLVLDFCTHTADAAGTTRSWHANLVNGYGSKLPLQQSCDADVMPRAWWSNEFESDTYIRQNLARHMLQCGRAGELLKVIIDYRWIQCMNGDEQQSVFEQAIADLELLRNFIHDQMASGPGTTEAESSECLVQDIEILVATMGMCAGICNQNRLQCSFQLYGRLVGIKGRSDIIPWTLWSIERFASRPWLKPQRGVLRNALGALKRSLPMRHGVEAMCVDEQAKEVVLGLDSGVWLKVQDYRTGYHKYDLAGHSGYVTCVKKDHDSGEIFSGSVDGTVRVWLNGEEIRCFEVFAGREDKSVWSVELLSEPQCLAVGSAYGTILLIDKNTGAAWRQLRGHVGRITSLTAFGGRNQLLVSGSVDGDVRIWDVGNCQQVGQSLAGHVKGSQSVAISSDERILASGCKEAIHLWDLGTMTAICEPLAVEDPVKAIAFSSDNTMLFAGGYNEIQVWNVGNPQDGVSLKCTYSEMIGNVTCMALVEDGKELLSGSTNILRKNVDGVSVWRTDGEQGLGGSTSDPAVDSATGRVDAVGTSSDGKLFAMCTKGSGVVTVRGIQGVLGGENDCVSIDVGYENVGRVTVSDDFSFVAYAPSMAVSDSTVYVVRTDTTEVVHEFKDFAPMLQGLRDSVQQSAESSEHQLEDRVVRMPMQYFSGHIFSLWFLDDEGGRKYIAAEANVMKGFLGEWQASMSVWDLDTGDCVSSDDSFRTTRVVGMPTVLKSVQKSVHVGVEKNVSGNLPYGYEIYVVNGSDRNIRATLEQSTVDAVYSAYNKRLWIVTNDRDLQYIDLVLPGVNDLDGESNPPVPQLRLPETKKHNGQASNAQAPFEVFISHAGPDKYTMALQLQKKLAKLGITSFVDKTGLLAGDNSPEKMIWAMNTSKIGVIILSPEFAARRWTMRELMCFQRRVREAAARGEQGPIIIPVFYRLSIQQCKDKQLYAWTTEEGESLFLKEGFFNPERQKEACTADVLESLKATTSIQGIENDEGASNMKRDIEDEESWQKRNDSYIDRIVEAVVSARERLGVRV